MAHVRQFLDDDDRVLRTPFWHSQPVKREGCHLVVTDLLDGAIPDVTAEVEWSWQDAAYRIEGITIQAGYDGCDDRRIRADAASETERGIYSDIAAVALDEARREGW